MARDLKNLNVLFLIMIILLLNLTLLFSAEAQTWTQLSPTGGPPTARSATSAVYDAISGRMIIFGGWACLPNCAPSFNDVWVLSDIPGIPALTQWGMLIFALVVGTGAVYVMKRRKLKV